ncbi:MULTISPECIES: hypothetical protein [unclassified Phaeobacter]|uniref:hypothetical protein n=1 Tax=unclassified Phaeobacter TaxID=2621772 RepID=UPI003A86E130
MFVKDAQLLDGASSEKIPDKEKSALGTPSDSNMIGSTASGASSFEFPSWDPCFAATSAMRSIIFERFIGFSFGWDIQKRSTKEP